MTHTLRHCGKTALSIFVGRPITPEVLTLSSQAAQIVSARGLARVARKTAKGKVECACAGHPWPIQTVDVKIPTERIDCNFDFRKLEVNPFDKPCDCKDPPPAAGCQDLGRPKEVCCRSIRQYGCCEEEEEDICEEEEEEETQVVIHKTCDLDFRKLEVNPYDDPCDCRDPPPPNSCESLASRADVCCRTPKPWGCACEAYDEPGLECFKEKSPMAMKQQQKKECNKKQFNAKCL